MLCRFALVIAVMFCGFTMGYRPLIATIIIALIAITENACTLLSWDAVIPFYLLLFSEGAS